MLIFLNQISELVKIVAWHIINYQQFGGFKSDIFYRWQLLNLGRLHRLQSKAASKVVNIVASKLAF